MNRVRFLQKIALMAGFALALAFTFSCSSVDGDNYEPEPYIENNGGFSVVPPKSWQVTDNSLSEYKVFMGPRENNFTANVNFVKEVYDGSLDDYVDLSIEVLEYYISNIEIIYRNPFVTLKNLEGQKVIAITEQLGYQLRQSFYFFPGKNGIKIVATCTALADSGEKYDEIFDNSMKTFEWIK